MAVRRVALAAAGDNKGVTPSRRRKRPSPREQARREAWGHKWGTLIGNATRVIREGSR